MTKKDANRDADRRPRDPPTDRDVRVREVQQITLWGVVVNSALFVVKLVGGIMGSSQALVVDAVHSLVDLLTDFVVLFGAPYWMAPPDADHPHGHGRIETIIACVIGVVLGVVGVGLGYRALVALRHPVEVIPGWVAFWVACASMVGKELLYHWTIRVGKRIASSAVVANAWDHRADAMSSLPVALAVLAARIQPEWRFLDPVAATIVAVFIVQAAWKIVWPALLQLSDAGVSKEELERLRLVVTNTEGVKTVHALRTRHIGCGVQIDLHVHVDPNLTVRKGHDIAHVVKRRLLDEGAGVVDVLVHIEPHEEMPPAATDTTP